MPTFFKKIQATRKEDPSLMERAENIGYLGPEIGKDHLCIQPGTAPISAKLFSGLVFIFKVLG
jgi:hypothetical protein